ncbi:hypothetical protein EBT16_04925 [bacterium]|nr:hypothetical protein [bacterium]
MQIKRTVQGVLLLTVFCFKGISLEVPQVKGATLTENGDYLFDAAASGVDKTAAQKMVDRAYQAGVRHLVLTPRAVMTHPRNSELSPMTPPEKRADERKRLVRLISYIHSKGMTVGIRPIFFVVDQNGQTPYVETLPDGTKKEWWHGNIQPENPNAWFESFKTYLDLYLPISTQTGVEEFTLGAELYSMTVGIEDQWKAYPHGFPAQWVRLLAYARTKLPPTTRIMYDINFTDDKIISDESGIEEYGGELARWRYRIVDLANRTDPEEKQVWKNLVDFWKGLDAIGVDMYRSLATENQKVSNRFNELVLDLKQAGDRYASQLDNALFEIESITKKPQVVILKEVGFRSVERGYINPFRYVGQDRGVISISDQAAAYEALFQSFWAPGWDWFRGVVLWDVSINPNLHGPKDTGFSFLGKPQTEEVVLKYFGG